jgi:hypothetical protein
VRWVCVGLYLGPCTETGTLVGLFEGLCVVVVCYATMCRNVLWGMVVTSFSACIRLVRGRSLCWSGPVCVLVFVLIHRGIARVIYGLQCLSCAVEFI